MIHTVAVLHRGSLKRLMINNSNSMCAFQSQHTNNMYIGLDQVLYNIMSL